MPQQFSLSAPVSHMGIIGDGAPVVVSRGMDLPPKYMHFVDKKFFFRRFWNQGVNHLSFADTGVWNLSFLKIKMSVFENLTVVKGLTSVFFLRQIDYPNLFKVNNKLTLSWRRSLPYRNESIDLLYHWLWPQRVY